MSKRALAPLALFLSIFVGSGVYFQATGTDFAFYQIATPVAALPAILLAVLLSRKKLNQTVESFLSGAGHSTIMAMCMIYLLAGAFSCVTKDSGGVDSTVNFAMTMIPSAFLLPGLFLVGALISTAMGTSMGTIAALAPIALGIASKAGLDLPLVAGAVVGGAMFGDNLSIISDTTIAATRTQGCNMKDKFRVNFFIAGPAAFLTIMFLIFHGGSGVVNGDKPYQLFQVIPYAAILIMALTGLNVFVVLFTGLVLAGIVGFITVPGFTTLIYARTIYAGFTGMQEIFILSIFIGGLGALMKEQGGLAFLEQKVELFIQRFSSGKNKTLFAELGIGILVFLTNLCTANNTVAILLTGDVAKNIAANNGVEPRRSAGILDIFSCICQGLIPWGAQNLLAASIFAISPLTVIMNVHYCLLLFMCCLVSIVINNKKQTSRSLFPADTYSLR
ncbi:MAG: Na+/H+ antiporter NhaC family protein [Desulfobacteraceae bacterium]|nr:Na+/H+ antiporter NhaC family protein [Desulfobacteraceae bacterium]